MSGPVLLPPIPLPDDDWLPFSALYGFSGERWPDLGHMAWRHSADEHQGCEDDPRLRCACPSTPSRNGCCARATQEDRLCDACRDHCYAVDDHGVRHALIDLY